MAITSESQILNKDAVTKACKIIREAADLYGQAASDVDNARQLCSGNNLSVDGKDMSESFDDVKNALSNRSKGTGVKENIEEFCNSVIEAATTIEENQRDEYKAYIAAQQNRNQ